MEKYRGDKMSICKERKMELIKEINGSLKPLKNLLMGLMSQ